MDIYVSVSLHALYFKQIFRYVAKLKNSKNELLFSYFANSIQRISFFFLKCCFIVGVTDLGVRFPGQSNRIQCRQRHATAATFLRSCVATAAERILSPLSK